MDSSTILLIGGFDSSGGAGISTDIKAASYLKTPFSLAISCFAFQTHEEGQIPIPVPLDIFEKNLASVFKEEIKYIKIGVIGTLEAATILRNFLQDKKVQIILDTPIFSSSGFLLQSPEVLKTLIPISLLITPNFEEYNILGGEQYFKTLNTNFLIKSVSKNNNIIKDELVLYQGSKGKYNYKKIDFTSPFLLSKENVRGTGCALSTLICIFLSHGFSLQKSVEKARKIIFKSRKKALSVKNAKLLFF